MYCGKKWWIREFVAPYVLYISFKSWLCCCSLPSVAPQQKLYSLTFKRQELVFCTCFRCASYIFDFESKNSSCLLAGLSEAPRLCEKQHDSTKQRRFAKIRNTDNFKLQTRNCKLHYAEFEAFQETSDAESHYCLSNCQSVACLHGSGGPKVGEVTG